MLWGVYISADDSSLFWAKWPGRRAEGVGGRGHYNDFLKSLCRGYTLYSLSHFSHWCVTHSLRFACFHATPGCVWECGWDQGKGDGWDSGVKCKGDFSTRLSWAMTPLRLWALGWLKKWNKKQDGYHGLFTPLWRSLRNTKNDRWSLANHHLSYRPNTHLDSQLENLWVWIASV